MNVYQLIIIGGGAAGFSAAIKANELGINSLMINNKKVGLGGTCVNVGCVPTKYLLETSKMVGMDKSIDFEGVNISVEFDFEEIIDGKNRIVDALRREKYVDVLDALENISFIEGDAKFISENEIDVNGQIITGDKFIVCTGSSTWIPPIDGLNDVEYLTNIEILKLKRLPESLIIIGGGPQAVEFAQIFSKFGTRVYMFKRSRRILKREEPELSNLLKRYLIKDGVEIFTGTKILRSWQRGHTKFVEVSKEGEKSVFSAEELLIATGRRANTKNLGIENTRIKLGEQGEILVDKEMKAAENIWAAGDVVGEPMLETVAAREGMIAAHNAFSDRKLEMEYDFVPHAIFTNPQVASVGLTDSMAIKKGYNCVCRTIPMSFVPKAVVIKDTRGAIKMVVDKETSRILGIHILSQNAADLIHEGVMIVKNEMTVDDVINTVHVFPTLSEAVKLAAQSFRKDITRMSCCVE